MSPYDLIRKVGAKARRQRPDEQFRPALRAARRHRLTAKRRQRFGRPAQTCLIAAPLMSRSRSRQRARLFPIPSSECSSSACPTWKAFAASVSGKKREWFAAESGVGPFRFSFEVLRADMTTTKRGEP